MKWWDKLKWKFKYERSKKLWRTLLKEELKRRGYLVVWKDENERPA